MRTVPCRLRNAFTLLEVLVVMAVVGLFLAMGSALLYSYVRLSGATTVQLDGLTIRRDLADAWRRDVRLAKSNPAPAKPDDKSSQVLDLPEGKVVWKLENHRLVRQVVGTKTEKTWNLGPGKNWLEFDTTGSLELLVLRHGEEKVNGRLIQGEYTAWRGGDLP